MTVNVGDFIKAKGRKYENHWATGFCIAVEGDSITVRDTVVGQKYECHREGAMIIPVVARVVASRASGWQHAAEKLPPPEDKGMAQGRDRRAYQTLLNGVASSTATAVQSYAEEHSLDIDSIKVELRCIKEFIVDRPRQDLGGGMIALADGHSFFHIFMDVFVDRKLDEAQKLRLRAALIFHEVCDLQLLNARVNIKMR